MRTKRRIYKNNRRFNKKSKRINKKSRRFNKKSKRSRRSRKKIGGSVKKIVSMIDRKPFFYLKMNMCDFAIYTKDIIYKQRIQDQITKDIDMLNELKTGIECFQGNCAEPLTSMKGGSWKGVQKKWNAVSAFKDILAEVRAKRKKFIDDWKAKFGVINDSVAEDVDVNASADEGEECLQTITNTEKFNKVQIIVNKLAELNAEPAESSTQKDSLALEIANKIEVLDIMIQTLKDLKDAININQNGGAGYTIKKSLQATAASLTDNTGATLLLHSLGNLTFGIIGTTWNWIVAPLLNANLTPHNPRSWDDPPPPWTEKVPDYGIERAPFQILKGTYDLGKQLFYSIKKKFSSNNDYNRL